MLQLVACVVAALASSSAAAVEIPKVGDVAPDFTMDDQDGRLVTRDSLRGKTFVLGFYPKDFTGG